MASSHGNPVSAQVSSGSFTKDGVLFSDVIFLKNVFIYLTLNLSKPFAKMFMFSITLHDNFHKESCMTYLSYDLSEIPKIHGDPTMLKYLGLSISFAGWIGWCFLGTRN